MTDEKKDEAAEMIEVAELVTETNTSLMIDEPVKLVLVRDLAPIAQRMLTYADCALTIEVTNEQQAKNAWQIEETIADDVKTVKDHEVLSGIISGLHTMHKKWTGLRNMFVPSMEASRKTIRDARIKWEDDELEKAAKEQRRLQAIADEEARKKREQQEKLERAQREKEAAARRAEQEALAKAAATEDLVERKKLEAEAERKRKEADAAALKAEMRQENAEAVAAPVIAVNAPVAKGGSRLAWEATVVSPQAFFQSVAQQPQLMGYVEIKLNALVAAKRANPLFSCAGITFRQTRK